MCKNHKVLLFGARQFIDKRIIFKNYEDQENNQTTANIYIYWSSLPDAKEKEIIEQYSSDDSYVTWKKTIMSIMKITYDFKTNKGITLTTFCQLDTKLGLMMKMATKALPKFTQQWFANLTKHLSLSHAPKSLS